MMAVVFQSRVDVKMHVQVRFTVASKWTKKKYIVFIMIVL